MCTTAKHEQSELAARPALGTERSGSDRVMPNVAGNTATELMDGPALKVSMSSSADESKCARGGRRLRVVFLMRSLLIGGAERQLVTLAKALDQSQFDVVVMCLYGGGQFEQELIDAGVPVISLQKSGRWEILGFIARLVRALRKLKPDILHSYLTTQNVLSASIKAALPTTHIVWGVRASNMDANRTGWLDRHSFQLEVLLSRFADLVVFNSVAGRDYHLAAGFAAARTTVIPNGVDTARFAPDPKAGAALRASWRMPAGSLVIGIVGRLDPMKDHSTFLRAAARFASVRPDARFVCIGDGSRRYFEHLRSLADQCGIHEKVLWTGFLKDMPDAYNALDLCTSSSAYGEGMPNCVAEAMACGVPCVVTDVGDSRLVVDELGMVVPPNSPESLADGWVAMARRIVQRPKLHEAIRDRIESSFSVETLVQGTSNALLSLQ